MAKAGYYADLNPLFPSKGQKRWTVFYRNESGGILIPIGVGSTSSKSRAESKARGMNAQAEIERKESSQ